MSKHIKHAKRNKAILALGAVPVLMVSAFASTAFSSWTGNSLSPNVPSFSLLSSITPVSGLGAAVDSAGTGIDLTWTPSTQKTDGSNVVSGYVTQGATSSSGPWTTLTSSSGSALTQTSSLVTNTVTGSGLYAYYRVAAVDNSWISSWSSPIKAPVLAPNSPTTTATVPDVTSGSTPTTITVPSGYYYIDVTLNGGSGGTAYFQPDTYVGVSELETMCAGYRYLTSGGTANPLSTAWGTSGNTVTAMIPVTPGETLSFITGIGDANINAVDSDFGGGFTGVFAGSTPSASDVLALAAGGNAGSMPSAGDTLSDPYYLTTATSPISLAGASVYGYVNEYNLFGSATYYTCPTPLSNGYEFSIQSTTPGSAYGSYGGTYSSSQANYITSKALSSYTTTTNANNPGVGSATYAFYK